MKKKVFILLLLLSLIIVGCNKKEETTNQEKTSVEEQQPQSPATNTEELITKTDNIEVTSVSTDTIEFKEEIKIEEGEKIAVWLYSKPKFLGYFNVILENGVKKIKGLEDALKNIEVESGEHNLALVTEKGESIGHIDIYIDEEKEILKEKPPVYTYKEIVEKQDIAFKTTKNNNANMKKGTTKTIQNGSKGIKEITYKITYDESGKQVSKEKINEKITKQAVNAIIEIGTSEFNMNTDKITGSMFGLVCTEDKASIASYDNLKHCNDLDYPESDFQQFGATMIGDIVIITRIGETNLSNPIRVTTINDYVYKGTYNGKTHYFDNRGGSGEQIPLTKDKCSELNIKCGTW